MSPTASQDPATACVASTREGLSDEQRLGQLLMVGFDTNAALGSLDDLVAEQHVGNVIYLGGWDGADKVTRTSEHLQGLVSTKATGDVALMIAADQEGGEVHQLRGDGFTRPPSAKVQAQMSPAQLTKAATGWARELEAAGVNVNLAPVTDTVPKDIGTANEPIGRYGRQYGSTPEDVSRSATAFLEGMLDGGIEGTVRAHVHGTQEAPEVTRQSDGDPRGGQGVDGVVDGQEKTRDHGGPPGSGAPAERLARAVDAATARRSRMPSSCSA